MHPKASRTALAVTAGSLLLLRCGGGGSVTTPVPPPVAVLAVELTGVETTPSPVAGLSFRTTVTIRIRETAGFGANINFVLLRFFDDDADVVEVASLGADPILAQTGSNRVEGRSTRELTLSFDHDTDTRVATGEIVVDFTDDAGNDSQKALPVTF